MKGKLLQFITLMIWSTTLAGQIIHVPDDQPTIQEGINAATTGDTVLISEGTYYENINYKGKAITVASQYLLDGNSFHILNTVIDGGFPSNIDSASVVSFVSGEDTNSVLIGLTIKGGTGSRVNTWGDSKIGGGIVCYYSGAKIIHNRILDNHLIHETYAFGGGLGVWAGNDHDIMVVISNNTFTDNTCQATGNSSQYRSGAGGGMYVCANAMIHNNYIQNNSCLSTSIADGAGVELESYDNANPFMAEIIGNTIKYNTAEGGAIGSWAGGLSIFGVKANVIDNIINQNTLISNVGAEGAGIYMIGSASPEDPIVFQGNEVTGNTIQGNCISAGIGLSVVIMLNRLEIRNNIFEENDGTTTNNSYGTVSFWIGTPEDPGHDAEIIIDGNIFKNNSSQKGGAIYALNCFNLSVTNNLFQGNYAEYGGGIHLNQSEVKSGYQEYRAQETMSVIANNTFVNNEALFFGSVIYNGLLTETVATFNNLLWQNVTPGDDDIYTLEASAPPILVSNSNIDTNNIYGQWQGSNNFYEDPLLTEDSLHIQGDSPCFNAGIESLSYGFFTFPCPSLDFDGEARPMYGSVDVGADEYFVVKTSDDFSQDQTYYRIYPNPFSGNTTFNITIDKPTKVNILVMDRLGRVIATIVNQSLSKGEHHLTWNAEGLPSGIYFYRLTANGLTANGKLVVVR